MTRTKDETLRVAARAVPVGETALATADPRDIASAVLEAVGFFRLEERYERLKRAINENCAGCSDACDKHGHAEDCGLTDWARSLDIQQRTIGRLEEQRDALLAALQGELAPSRSDCNDRACYACSRCRSKLAINAVEAR